MQLSISLAFLFTFLIHYAVANKIDSLQLYAYYNAQQHNTRPFETVKPDSSSDLILRRGANAYLAVKLTEPFDPQVSQLYLRIMFGKNHI